KATATYCKESRKGVPAFLNQISGRWKCSKNQLVQKATATYCKESRKGVPAFLNQSQVVIVKSCSPEGTRKRSRRGSCLLVKPQT
ncbi:hypothetical protein J6590_046817, partial [Homalodisca vitripennis]